VTLAPNGIDVDRITAMLNSLPQVEEHTWGRIISVSSLHRYKGIHENLLALKKLQDHGIIGWQYTIVGDGPYRQELEALSGKLGIQDKVAFTGWLRHGDVIQKIYESDIFCLPSWAEAFGNVYAEAAVCGRPVIGCQGFGAEIMVCDRETGLLVPPKNVDAIADALAYLLAHPEIGQSMGRAAQKHIRQFTWERTAQLYMETISRILSNEGSNSPDQAADKFNSYFYG